MVTRVNTDQQPGVAELAGGIVDDVQKLVAQEAKLLRAEVEQEWEKAKEAVVHAVIGAVLATLAGILLAFTFVYLLHDYAKLSQFASFGIVTIVFAAIGGGFLLSGRRKAAEVNVVPEQTVESIAEVTGNG